MKTAYAADTAFLLGTAEWPEYEAMHVHIINILSMPRISSYRPIKIECKCYYIYIYLMPH